MKNKTLTGHLAAFITILIWGTTFITTKVLLRSFSPIEILFIRFVIGYLALWCACPKSFKPADRKQEGYFVLAGLLGVTLYYLFENIALTYTLASNVGVIISIAPFFTVIFTCVFLREGRPGARFFCGFLIAMAGIFLISFDSGQTLKLNPMGDILAVIAAVLWASYSTLMKKITGFGYNTVQVTRRIFFYGIILMVPALFWMGFDVKLDQFLEPVMLMNLIFLGLGASALCFATWNYAVKILGSVKTIIYIYMVPVITAVTSALILHEKMTKAMICGIFLTLLGLFLSEDRRKKERKN